MSLCVYMCVCVCVCIKYVIFNVSAANIWHLYLKLSCVMPAFDPFIHLEERCRHFVECNHLAQARNGVFKRDMVE